MAPGPIWSGGFFDMKIKTFFINMLLCSGLCIAQNHDATWIFGYDNNNDPKFQDFGGVLVRFENGEPVFNLENTRYGYSLYCTVCSDSSGNLMFHSNGTLIQNRLHNIMQNGDTLNPGNLRDQSVEYGVPSLIGGMAVPAPGLPHHYYLIHTFPNDNLAAKDLYPVLYYSLIDMNANNGLGRVIKKNQVLAKGDFPSPVITKHGNGRDWWVIVGDYKNKVYKTFLISPQGISAINDQQIAEESFLLDAVLHSISMNGDLFVNNEAHGIGQGLWLFDFDRCSGLLHNPRLVPKGDFVEVFSNVFSPDDRFLYVNSLTELFQIDLQTLDSVDLVVNKIAQYNYGYSPYPPFASYFYTAELAPNGKIYYNQYNATKSYHVLHQPGLPGLAADLEQQGQAIPRWRNGTWCHFPYYRLGRWQDSPCDTLPFTAVEDKFQHQPWKPPVRYRFNEAIKVLKVGPIGGLPLQTQPANLPDMSPKGIMLRRIREMQEKGLLKLPATVPPNIKRE
jgi:hypothetical protein